MERRAGAGRRVDATGRRLADHLAEIVVQGVSDYAIFALDPEGRVMSWNPGAKATLGYAESEIVGRPYALLREPDVESPSVTLERVAERGLAEDEGWRLRKGGARLWVHELITALHSESGQLIAFAVLLRDRTAQKRAEEARIRSEQMFTGIVHASPDGIVSVDESQRIVLFNRAAETIFGHRAEAIIGEPLDVLIPEGQREAQRREVAGFLESSPGALLLGEGSTECLLGLRSDGHVFPIEAAISKTRVGGEWLLTAVVRDVSLRVREARARDFLVRAAPALESSLDFGTTLRDAAWLSIPEWADWCIVYLAEPDGSIRLVQVSHADAEMAGVAERLQAYPVPPGRDHPVRGVIAGGEPVLLSEVTAPQLEAVAQSEEHLQLLRSLGLRSAILAPLVAHRRSLGAIALFSAGRYRRYDEIDLWLAGELGRRAGLALDNARLYDEARQAVRERDEIVSVVSHDLRNPLNSILMASELLEEQLEGELDPEAIRKAARIVIRSAGRMDRMVGDLLDISRIESGRLHLELRPTDPGALLEEAYLSLAPLAAEAGLLMELVQEDGLPPVSADPDRLHQVLSNLVGNALKFTAAGGTIALRAGATPEGVVVSVHDTGVGIPQEHLPHLFDRFWQAKRSDRRGIGLGLPIVKGIVDAHGGAVGVESEEGVGSTFSFSIPLAAPRPVDPGTT